MHCLNKERAGECRSLWQGARLGLVACLLLVWGVSGADVAEAQLEQPADTPVQQRLVGQVLSASGAPTPESGDQVAAFFEDQVVGLFTFTSDQEEPRAYEMIVFGDDPNTQAVEGPSQNDIVSFRFFRSSTGFVRTDVAPLNDNAEISVFRFNGADVGDILDFPVPLPPELFIPSVEMDLLLGADPSSPGNGDGGSGGGSGGGGGGAAAPNFDVDGDGRVTRGDAAAVIRLVIGASRAVSDEAAARADVNGDGVVDTRDAIAILKSRRN